MNASGDLGKVEENTDGAEPPVTSRPFVTTKSG